MTKQERKVWDEHVSRCKQSVAAAIRINRVPEAEDAICVYANAEISRLRGMAAYALDAPNIDSCKSILRDLLDGVNGAENYEGIKGERGILLSALLGLMDEPQDITRPSYVAALEAVRKGGG